MDWYMGQSFAAWVAFFWAYMFVWYYYYPDIK
jgi:hypothetical protein